MSSLVIQPVRRCQWHRYSHIHRYHNVPLRFIPLIERQIHCCTHSHPHTHNAPPQSPAHPHIIINPSSRFYTQRTDQSTSSAPPDSYVSVKRLNSKPRTGTPKPSTPDNSTFVSNHYRVDTAQLRNYLTHVKRFDVRETATAYVVRECPFCPPIKNSIDNMYKWYVFKDNGRHYCHRCGSQGSYFDMKKRLGDGGIEMSDVMGKQVGDGSEGKQNNDQNVDKVHAYHTALSACIDGTNEEYTDVVEYLTNKRGLTTDTLKYYHVGAKTHSFINENNTKELHHCVVFPWSQFGSVSDDKPAETEADTDTAAPTTAGTLITPATHVGRVKLRSITEKRHQRIEPSGTSVWGWFGGHTVPPTATSIYITEGEFDAMACYQATKQPTVSVPNGAKSLPIELVKSLERFERIYLWMDNDLAGADGTEKFVQKLGVNRCYIIKPSETEQHIKDANDALLQGVDMKQMIRNAAIRPHQQITTFKELRADILRELNEPDRSRGIPSMSLPSLNRILKGHRRGELTILTGPTGVGKTTVLSQLSLDYCQQNVVTLWGSFEIKNSRLARTMLGQYAGINLNSHINAVEVFDAIADKFEQLPMYFLRYFGSTSIDQVIDAMEYAVYVYDVEHIVLDNLQFMLSTQHRGGTDKFDVQDKALDQLRHFATNKNVHITLVCHPRKEQDKHALGIASIFGSGKVTQEADNIIILQANSGAQQAQLSNGVTDNSPMNDNLLYSDTRRLEVRKNRYDGDLGYFEYQYHKDKCRVIEVGADPNYNVFGINARVPIAGEGVIDSDRQLSHTVDGSAQHGSTSGSRNGEVIVARVKRVRPQKPKQATQDVLTE